jgi:hypothetical protein
MQLTLGVGGGLDRGAAGRQPHRQRRPLARGAGLGEPVAAHGLAGRSGGVQGVGLGAMASGGSLGPVQLHHLLAMTLEEAGQTGAVAAGALDRPDPLARLSTGERKQLPVASRGGRHGHLLDHRAADCQDDRGSMGVLVGVDPDDELDEVCQHGHALTPCPETT